MNAAWKFPKVRAECRIVPTLALTATVVALLAFVLQHREAAVWAVVVALVLAVCGLGTLAAETIGLRADRDDADRRNEHLEAECQRLHLQLTEAQLAAGVTSRALRVVPTQRSDSWLEAVMDEQAALGEEGA